MLAITGGPCPGDCGKKVIHLNSIQLYRVIIWNVQAYLQCTTYVHVMFVNTLLRICTVLARVHLSHPHISLGRIFLISMQYPLSKKGNI